MTDARRRDRQTVRNAKARLFLRKWTPKAQKWVEKRNGDQPLRTFVIVALIVLLVLIVVFLVIFNNPAAYLAGVGLAAAFTASFGSVLRFLAHDGKDAGYRTGDIDRIGKGYAIFAGGLGIAGGATGIIGALLSTGRL